MVVKGHWTSQCLGHNLKIFLKFFKRRIWSMPFFFKRKTGILMQTVACFGWHVLTIGADSITAVKESQVWQL